MKTTYIIAMVFILGIFIFIGNRMVSAEQLTLTTYYPAPDGTYENLVLKTLEVEEAIGIGTAYPEESLHITTDDAGFRLDSEDDTRRLEMYGPSGATYMKISALSGISGAATLSLNPDGGVVTIGTSMLVGGGTPAAVVNNSMQFFPRPGDPNDPTNPWPATQEGTLAYSDQLNQFYYYDGNVWMAQGGGGTGGGGCYIDYDEVNPCKYGTTNLGSVGTWGACTAYSASLWPDNAVFFRPPGAPCPGAFSKKDVGLAYLCCK